MGIMERSVKVSVLGQKINCMHCELALPKTPGTQLQSHSAFHASFLSAPE